MTFATTVVLAIADLAAWTVSLKRELVHHADDGARAVHVVPLVGAPWWRLDAWIVRDDQEHSLEVRVLGYSIEVFYRPGSVSVPV